MRVWIPKIIVKIPPDLDAVEHAEIAKQTADRLNRTARSRGGYTRKDSAVDAAANMIWGTGYSACLFPTAAPFDHKNLEAIKREAKLIELECQEGRDLDAESEVQA